jgi:hypothetical protein
MSLNDISDESCACTGSKTTFGKELERLVNIYCQENGSDTPDFILAQYILGCLDAFNGAVRSRDEWYGRGTKGCLK